MAARKNWDDFVAHAESIARQPGFQELRDRLIGAADAAADDVVLDVGAGTGLLTLALAPRCGVVWALDVSPAMLDYLQAKARSGGHSNIELACTSAVSLPLVDSCVDVVVSNYCLHHLTDDEKRRALSEMRRVLRPGGRMAIGDMMFSMGLSSARDRDVARTKARAMLRRGVPGAVRLGRHAARLALRRHEHPAPASWWDTELRACGFENVHVEELAHEGGVAFARAPSAGDAAKSVLFTSA